jgi:hypothetical protein
MDSLPDIVMPEVEEVKPEDDKNNIKMEINDTSDNEDLMVELEKPKMSQEQIFQTPIIKKVNEKPIKPKRVLSEEHKEKLKLAREKALLTRQANAAIKKETKELEKKVKTNKLNKLRTEANGPQEEPYTPLARRPPTPPQAQEETKNNISQKELEAVALNAIIGHEKIRTERKKQTKEEQEVLYQQNLLKQQLSNVVSNKPIHPHYSTNGVWDDFF